MEFLDKIFAIFDHKEKPTEDTDKIHEQHTQTVEQRRQLLDEIGKKPDFPQEMFSDERTKAKIREQEQKYLEPRLKAGLETSWHRAGKYMSYVEEIFDQENVPRELAHLAFLESRWDIKSKSSAGATGLFNLMPGTAMRLGLRIEGKPPMIDERKDLLKSARATARLLSILYNQTIEWKPKLKDDNQRWGWTLLCYNKDPQEVKKSYKKHKSDLSAYISATDNTEQAEYLIKFYATRNLIAQMKLEQEPPLEFNAVRIFYKKRPEPMIHTIQKGETISTITKKYRAGRTEITAANIRLNPRFNPNKLKPGKKILIPQEPEGQIYFSDLLEYLDVTEGELVELNPQLGGDFFEDLYPLPDRATLYLPQGLGSSMETFFASTIEPQYIAQAEMEEKNLYTDLAYEALV